MASVLDKAKDFLTDNSGAVTVDWVVLTAAVSGLGLSSAVAVRGGVGDLATDIQAALSNASVALILPGTDPNADLDLSSAAGYANQTFYFFTPAGVTNWYNNNVKTLSDADLLVALDQRRAYMEAELAMGPNDAPSYGEPWGHTDMYNLTRWEAAYRGLI
ncbi:MAG: hypothetical protein H6900_01700 [Rhodobacter sp.]|mgnify:CR=1 FL=1|nr:hypothetical protein [Paracoccaceae bacterium]MCC0071982.1 hypothetical protein [Rhodobacter sp.]